MSKKHDETDDKTDEKTTENTEENRVSLGGDYTGEMGDPAQPGTVSDPGNSGAVKPAAETDDK